MKNPQSQAKHCIFCGAKGNLSKQHVIPNRLRKLVNRKENHHFDAPVMFHKISQDSVAIQQSVPKRRNGHAGSRTLRVVCKPCNEGWMNTVEQKAFEILTPAILGQPWSLEKAPQEAIALFAGILFTMVDLCHLPTSASSQSERDEIYNDRRLPGGWNVFIGRFNSSERSCWFRHFGGTVRVTNELGNAKIHKVQFSTIGLGKVGFHLVSFGGIPMQFDPATYAKIFGVASITNGPTMADSRWLAPLDTQRIDDLADRLAVQFMADSRAD